MRYILCLIGTLFIWALLYAGNETVFPTHSQKMYAIGYVLILIIGTICIYTDDNGGGEGCMIAALAILGGGGMICLPFILSDFFDTPAGRAMLPYFKGWLVTFLLGCGIIFAEGKERVRKGDG